MRRVPAGLVADEMCRCGEVPGAHTHSFEIVCPVCGYSEMTDVTGRSRVPQHSVDRVMAHVHRARPGPCHGSDAVVVAKLYPHHYFG
jgi:hypothetical protein